MTTPYSYAWEKLYDAVRTLARGSGPLAERLKDAYASSLIRLRPDDFPDSVLRERFTDLKNEMAPEGRFDIALSAWPELDLKRIADAIVSLYDAVVRKRGDR